MDICHLPLDKPCQYNKNLMYNWWCNTYTPSIKGKFIALMLIKEGAAVENKGKHILFLFKFIEKKEN
jgi:hypothetical protein